MWTTGSSGSPSATAPATSAVPVPPSDLKTCYDDMRQFREKYPFRDGNAGGAYSAAPIPCTFRSFTPPEKLVGLPVGSPWPRRVDDWPGCPVTGSHT
ncbi:hypothetical protein GCM10009754_79540 [Amycolatopsis minnesotensis]|uniref:Uncharacterized protein n=1 Tax=Amycolatopsis minnesotensis TaxID=337894 RepID=A0ABN2SPI4_9PSEU